MVEYSKVNVRLSDAQLKKLKNPVKKKTGTSLRINLKMLAEMIYLMNYYWQQMQLRNAFNNNMSADLTLYKAHISKIIQSGEFLGSLLSKLAGPLMKVAISLAKNILAPWGTTAAASGIDARIQNKIHSSGTTTFISSNKEMNDILKSFKPSKIIIFCWKK